MGKIEIIREKKFLGCAMSFDVIIDGQSVGSISNGNSISKEVEFGTHNVAINLVGTGSQQEIIIDQEHQNAEIHVVAKLGLLAAKPTITNVIYK